MIIFNLISGTVAAAAALGAAVLLLPLAWRSAWRERGLLPFAIGWTVAVVLVGLDSVAAFTGQPLWLRWTITGTVLALSGGFAWTQRAAIRAVLTNRPKGSS